MKRLLHTAITAFFCLSAVLCCGCKTNENELSGSIYGMISIAGTAEPMRGTGVALHYMASDGKAGALLLRTTTSDDGTYTFEDIKPNEYVLRVEVPGYKVTEYTVIVESGRKAKADIHVIPKGEGDDETDEYYILQAAGLMVQKKDLGYVNWETATEMCKGSTLAGYTDWRLPSIHELMILYNNRYAIGGFIGSILHDYYWSSTTEGNYIKVLDFYNGQISSLLSSNCFSVRAVRSINPTIPEEPYVAIPELHLMVQKNDLGFVNFSSAEGLCAGSIVGGFTNWRLPTITELQSIYVNRAMIGNFHETYEYGSDEFHWYWSSTMVNDESNKHYILDFTDGSCSNYLYGDGSGKCSVRAVRTTE